ncbi:MAG: hypothetical protein R3F02_16840 [Thiolinea sp.]
MKRNTTHHIVLPIIILSLNPLPATTAAPITKDILGYGCIVTEGNFANSVITITNADLVKAHGVLAPNTTITHVVNFNYDFGVTDTSCLGAKASITLDSTDLPTTSEVSFDSLVIDGDFTETSIFNNTGHISLTLTMTTQTPVNMATPFTYYVPFTLNATVSIPK